MHRILRDHTHRALGGHRCSLMSLSPAILLFLLCSWSLVDANLHSPALSVGNPSPRPPVTVVGNQSRDIANQSVSSTADDTQTEPVLNQLLASFTSRNIDSQAVTVHDYQESGTDALHDTFLLMSSANSIRFWSTSCPPHSSANLLTLPRRSLVKFGITGIALWRPTPDAVQLVWYDAEQSAFHRATIQRRHEAIKCDELLALEFNQSLSFNTNPHVRKDDKEARVKVAIDSRRHLLFASNYQNNRIDVYQLDKNTLAKNEIIWVASWTTKRPFDVALDERNEMIFWLENSTRICNLSYGLEESLKGDLSEKFACSSDLVPASGANAITLNPTSQKVIWSNPEGQIYQTDYHDNRTATHLGQAPENQHRMMNLAMYGTDSLYMTVEHEVYLLNLTKGHFDLLSIESNTQFSLLVLDRLPDAPDVLSTTTPKSPVPSTTTPSPAFVSTTSLPAPQPPIPTTGPSTGRILLFTLVPCLLLLIIVSLGVLCCCTSGGGRLDNLQRRLHLDPHRTRQLFVNNRFARYNQLRKGRANSAGRDQLIEEDEDIEEGRSEASESIHNGDVTASHHHAAALPRVTSNFYRSNIMRQSSGGLDDIEDMFGHRSVPSGPMRPCIACRDSDICIDKGICMATYRVC